MNKLKNISIILLIAFVSCSCGVTKTQDDGITEKESDSYSDLYTTDSAGGTIIPPTDPDRETSLRTDEPVQIKYYEINSVDSDMSFDDWVECLTDEFGREYYDPYSDIVIGYDYTDGYARYFRDFSQHVDMMEEQQENSDYPQPIESFMYCIRRAVWDSEDGIKIEEYNNDITALIRFREIIDMNIENSNRYPDRYLVDNLGDRGCLITYTRDYYYGAVYLFGDTIVSIGINLSLNGETLYDNYLSLFEDLGLPNVEINDMIMS